MSKKPDSIADILDIEPVVISEEKTLLLTSDSKEVVPVENNDGLLPAVTTEEKPQEVVLLPDLETDYKLARENMMMLLQKGGEILRGAMETAQELGIPRGYEVASKVLKDVSDVTKDFYGLQKSTKELKSSDYVPPKTRQGNLLTENGINVDKAIFVGNANDLFKQIKNEKEENMKDITPDASKQ